MRHLLPWLLLLPACGGGGGGGDDPPPPPPPPYAQTTTTGLAIGNSFPNAAVLPPFVLVAVSEAEMGADRNGDGDLLDSVVHQYGAVTGAVSNLGLAVTGRILVSDRHFAFLVVEAAQGGADLDGDGDASDAVWFVYDPARAISAGANPVNTGLSAPATGAAGAGTTGGFVLVESEAAARADRNGDGDSLDSVPAAFDGAVFAVSVLTLPAHSPAAPLVARAGRVLFAASEAAQGAPLNGDGDQQDNALFAVDFATGLPRRVPVGGAFPRAVANHPYALTSSAAVYLIDEAGEGGLDLNFDGDATDAIIAVFDLATGSGETLPQTPLIPSFAVAGAVAVGIGTGESRALLAISESGQRRDINNDFDQVDFILAWVDTGSPFSLRVFPTIALAARTPAIDGDRGLIAVAEGASGFSGTDLNLDGDTGDAVAFVVDTAVPTGTTINLRLAVTGYALGGLDAFLGVDEAAQGGTDFNGNAATTDVVQFYVDLGDPLPAPRGLGIVATSRAFFRLDPRELRLAAAMPEGQSPAYDDLNEDGDRVDAGLVLIEIDPGRDPPSIVAPTPFFAGSCSAGPASPLRATDDIFAFPTAEAMGNEDLNGDGDRVDTVLCCAEIG